MILLVFNLQGNFENFRLLGTTHVGKNWSWCLFQVEFSVDIDFEKQGQINNFLKNLKCHIHLRGVNVVLESCFIKIILSSDLATLTISCIFLQDD